MTSFNQYSQHLRRRSSSNRGSESLVLNQSPAWRLDQRSTEQSYAVSMMLWPPLVQRVAKQQKELKQRWRDLAATEPLDAATARLRHEVVNPGTVDTLCNALDRLLCAVNGRQPTSRRRWRATLVAAIGKATRRLVDLNPSRRLAENLVSLSQFLQTRVQDDQVARNLALRLDIAGNATDFVTNRIESGISSVGGPDLGFEIRARGFYQAVSSLAAESNRSSIPSAASSTGSEDRSSTGSDASSTGSDRSSTGSNVSPTGSGRTTSTPDPPLPPAFDPFLHAPAA